MPKTFYTERDIEDMVQRGVRTLEVNDNVVLTNNAYEKAKALGMQLLRDQPDVPPTAPIRPYISKPQAQSAPPTAPQPAPSAEAKAETPSTPAAQPQRDGARSDLRQRIHKAVAAKLGDQVDPDLLDVIITRVFQNTGIQ